MYIPITPLRNALEELIAQNNDLGSHRARLLEIEGQSIKILELILDPANDFNCVMYAFNFRLEMPTNVFGRYYANTEYLKYLIDNQHLIEVSEQDLAHGDYCVYSFEDKLTHIGVLSAERLIKSKWGMGHIFEHPIEQCPISYGNTVKFYKQITEDDALDHFYAFYD